MKIVFACPSCKVKIEATERAAGRKVRCPKCQTEFVVPAQNPPAPGQPSVQQTPPAPKPAPQQSSPGQTPAQRPNPASAQPVAQRPDPTKPAGGSSSEPHFSGDDTINNLIGPLMQEKEQLKAKAKIEEEKARQRALIQQAARERAAAVTGSMPQDIAPGQSGAVQNIPGLAGEQNAQAAAQAAAQNSIIYNIDSADSISSALYSAPVASTPLNLPPVFAEKKKKKSKNKKKGASGKKERSSAVQTRNSFLISFILEIVMIVVFGIVMSIFPSLEENKVCWGVFGVVAVVWYLFNIYLLYKLAYMVHQGLGIMIMLFSRFIPLARLIAIAYYCLAASRADE